MPLPPLPLMTFESWNEASLAAWPIRSWADEAAIWTPSPRLPATVDPLAISPMKLPWTVSDDEARVTPGPPAFTSESELTVEPSDPAANRRP